IASRGSAAQSRVSVESRGSAPLTRLGASRPSRSADSRLGTRDFLLIQLRPIRPTTSKLGLFDATMIVMGGIVGSGIFINPYVVARQVPSTILILAAWAFGGLIALAGAFIYAELSS